MNPERVAIVRQSSGSLYNVETGEVYAFGSDMSRHAYSQSVTQIVASCLVSSWSRVVPNRRGRLLAAFGAGVAVRDLQSSYPGCSTTADVGRAEDALLGAGLGKGMSPAGRALDYAHRTNKSVRQWRAALPLQELALSSLFGGIQIGARRPAKRARNGMVRITEDIVSSYPFTASGILPSVAHARVERGKRKGAVLWLVGGIQNEPVLFTRDGDTVAYNPVVYGWYTPEEVEYHAAFGRFNPQTVRASLTVSRGDRYLASTIEHLFAERERHPRGTPERSVIKAGLNGLLGKFAAPLSSWRMATKAERDKLKRSRAYPLITIGPVAIVDDPKMRGLYHRNTNGLWTSISYSRARVRLWQKMDDIAAQGGRVLWVHTDCVVADVPTTYRATYGTELGAWRRVE